MNKQEKRGTGSTGSIYRRGEHWWVSYCNEGRRVRVAGGATRVAATEKLRLLTGQGAGIRTKTLRRDLRILGAVFRLAHANGKLAKTPTMPKVRASKPTPHILSPDGLEKVIANALRPEVRGFLVAAAFTGARSGERRRFTWGDEHLERGLVIFRDTKSGVDREVPLHPRLRETLCELGLGAPDTLVFTNTHGGTWHQGELSKARVEPGRGRCPPAYLTDLLKAADGGGGNGERLTACFGAS